MRPRNPDEPIYNIGVAAALVSSHPQTLRMYERSGLVCPSRSGGNVRLYSERDILRIKRIQSFTQMGVNLAGIDIIFRLLEQIEQLEGELAQQQAARRRQDEDQATEALRARLRGERER